MDCSAQGSNLYQRVGGDAGLDAFVSRLYDVMASDAEAEYIWKWHPADMAAVKERLHAFLSGWLGGPNVYPERFGAPMMRRRHMDFPIGPRERDIWMTCARTALADTVPDAQTRAELEQALTAMAEHMRNMSDDGRRTASGCGCGGSCAN